MGKSTRRAEYAAVTRQAIMDAARRLFAERGYAATKVEDIADAARVAAPTVYAAGGKSGLLRNLMEAWCAAEAITETYDRIAQLDDGVEILGATAAGTRRVREQWGDIMRVFLTTAPHDRSTAETLALATERYCAGMRLTATRLATVGALRPGISVEHATDVLWFYFGYTAYFTLIDDNKWTLDQAEQWLLEAARNALL